MASHHVMGRPQGSCDWRGGVNGPAGVKPKPWRWQLPVCSLPVDTYGATGIEQDRRGGTIRTISRCHQWAWPSLTLGFVWQDNRKWTCSVDVMRWMSVWVDGRVMSITATTEHGNACFFFCFFKLLLTFSSDVFPSYESSLHKPKVYRNRNDRLKCGSAWSFMISFWQHRWCKKDVKWSGEKLWLKNAFSNRRCSVWQIAILLSSISHRCKPVFTSSPNIIAEAKTSFPPSHCLKVLSTLREWPCVEIASTLTKKERFAWSPSHKDILLQISCAPESAFTEHICQSRQMERDCLFYIQCQQESALDFRWCQSVTVNLTKTLMVQPECPTYTEKRQIIKNKPRRRTTRWILHLAWIKTKNAWKKCILLWHVQGCTLQKEAGIENGWVDMEERLHSIKTMGCESLSGFKPI